jgi:hypothetical protein
MELLQNCKCTPENMTDHHFCEIKLCIESIIELCQEGEISVYEADSIVFNEYVCSIIHIQNLSDNLKCLKEDRPESVETNQYREALDNMAVYNGLIQETYKILKKLEKSEDYQQKRKKKIKTQIIKEGLTIPGGKSVGVQNTDTKTPNEEKDQPESKTTLSPVIQDVLKEGLLNAVPVNGKYVKKGEKKDTDIIKWIFDNYPIYEDSLTADLYMQYIQTNVKPQTIGQYIARFRKEAEKNLSCTESI